MPIKNSNQRTRESKFAEGFRISSEPLVRPDNQQEKVANERDDVGLPRVYGAPILYAIGVARHDETFSCAVPIAAFISIVVLLWRRRHEDDREHTRRPVAKPERIASVA